MAWTLFVPLPFLIIACSGSQSPPCAAVSIRVRFVSPTTLTLTNTGERRCLLRGSLILGADTPRSKMTGPVSEDMIVGPGQSLVQPYAARGSGTCPGAGDPLRQPKLSGLRVRLGGTLFIAPLPQEQAYDLQYCPITLVAKQPHLG
jgi:hypothetical protein